MACHFSPEISCLVSVPKLEIPTTNFLFVHLIGSGFAFKHEILVSLKCILYFVKLKLIILCNIGQSLKVCNFESHRK